MTESFAWAVRGRCRPGARFVFRTGRRTLVESLYLLTAPATAAAGLLLAFGGLCVATVGLLVPGGSPVVAGALAPARWFADLERWRMARVGSPAGGAAGAAVVQPPSNTTAVAKIFTMGFSICGIGLMLAFLSRLSTFRERYDDEKAERTRK